jgi:hypothetical protein
MRPGTTRPFSTTRRVAQQQLYKPYVPELNQEQIKAIRKVARQNAPNYHGHSSKDAIWVLKVCAANWLPLERDLTICSLSLVQEPRGHCCMAPLKGSGR